MSCPRPTRAREDASMASAKLWLSLFGAFAGIALSCSCAALAVERIAPRSGPWEAGQFKFDEREKKTRRSLSGIACPGEPGNAKACLVVFDEGTVAHYVTLSADGYSIDNAVL